MAFANTFAFFAVVFLLHRKTVATDFLSPLLSPIFDNVCKHVECGKGRCKAPSNGTMLFECECDAGWKQMDHHLKFLPCIIPNCTLDLACGQAPSPVSQRPIKDNISFSDPCHWTHCGGGLCNKTSAFMYSCECQAGYNNLLNASSFPCFKECALGMDCANLGITVQNSSTSPDPALSDSGKNQGLDLSGGSCQWIFVIASLSLTLWT